MNDLLSDGDLIRASLEDPAVFGGVFERHYRAIYDYLARRVGLDHAGDLAADVFTIAFANRRRFHKEATEAAPWLYGIATNVARRHWRKTSRRSTAYSRASAQLSWIDPTEHADSRIDAARIIEALGPALARLRRRDRDILYLYALTDLTYDQVAEAAGVPVGTVRSSLSRTRAKLRNSLQASGQEPPESPESQRRRP